MEKILNTLTERPKLTESTQIRPLLKELSDQGLHYLQFNHYLLHTSQGYSFDRFKFKDMFFEPIRFLNISVNKVDLQENFISIWLVLQCQQQNQHDKI